jgi:hypothetical protein
LLFSLKIRGRTLEWTSLVGFVSHKLSPIKRVGDKFLDNIYGKMICKWKEALNTNKHFIFLVLGSISTMVVHCCQLQLEMYSYLCNGTSTHHFFILKFLWRIFILSWAQEYLNLSKSIPSVKNLRMDWVEFFSRFCIGEVLTSTIVVRIAKSSFIY